MRIFIAFLGIMGIFTFMSCSNSSFESIGKQATQKSQQNIDDSSALDVPENNIDENESFSSDGSEQFANNEAAPITEEKDEVSQPNMVTGSFLVHCENLESGSGVACNILNAEDGQRVEDISLFQITIVNSNGEAIKFDQDQLSIDENWSFIIPQDSLGDDWKIQVEAEDSEASSEPVTVSKEDLTVEESLQHGPSYFKEITILGSQVFGQEELIDFPVLISLEDRDLNRNSRADGSDISFHNENGLLDFEIELYQRDVQAGVAKLVAWVRIPNLSPASDTKIKMLYGPMNLKEDNPQGVWNDSYKLVWHLGDQNSSKDSTVNQYDGIHEGGPSISSSKIGNALSFDGVDDFVSTNITASTLGVGGDSARTFSIWAKLQDGGSVYGSLFRIGRPGGGCCVYLGYHLARSRTNIAFGVGGEYSQNAAWNNPFNFEEWYHYSAVYDGNAGLKIYRNGQILHDVTLSNKLMTNDFSTFQIGEHTYFLAGILDEVRIANRALPEPWIQTEYNNQNSPSTFYSISNEQPYIP